jgi:outer membrane protein assembly factor BamB
MNLRLCLLVFLCFSFAAPLTAEDWPQFRGLGYRAVSTETDWKATWDQTPAIWEAKVHSGAASVAVADGRVYTQGVERLSAEQAAKLKKQYPDMNSRRRELLMCLDAATGEQLWATTMDAGRISGRNMSYPTPTVVGGDVYAFSTSGVLMRVRAETGEVIWKHDLMDKLGAVDTRDGLASSPLVHGGRIHLHIKLPKPEPADPNRKGWKRRSFVHVFAFDTETGKEVWRSRPYDPRKDGGNHSGGCWSSPVHMVLEGKPTLVSYFGNMVVGLDPADGSHRWEFNFKENLPEYAASKKTQFYSSTWPQQVGDNGVLCQVWNDHPSQCWRSRTILLRIVDGRPRLAWQNKTLAVQLANFTIWKGHIYAMDTTMAKGDRRKRQEGIGQLQCVDLETGKLLWHTSAFFDPELDSPRNRENCDNAPTWLIVDGRIIIWDGVQLIIGKVSPDGYERLTAFQLQKRRHGGTWAAMAFADGRLFVRAGHALYGVDLRKDR